MNRTVILCSNSCEGINVLITKEQTKKLKILHLTQLQDYNNTIRHIETTLNEQIPNQPLKPTLASLLGQASNFLNRVRINKDNKKRL